MIYTLFEYFNIFNIYYSIILLIVLYSSLIPYVIYQINSWTHFYVDKSTIDWDVDYFDRFDGHNPSTDPGLGVLQRCDGMFDIPVVGVDIVSIKKKETHILQKRYSMESGHDEDYIITPTLHSILTKNVPLPFRVNHSQFHPTHKLIWYPHELDYPHSHYVLKSIKHIKSGMEILFDYNYGRVVYKL